jgi:hypothetical protein
MRLEKMPVRLPPPDPTLPIVHWHWPSDEPIECGIEGRVRTTSRIGDVTCVPCLTTLDIILDPLI